MSTVKPQSDVFPVEELRAKKLVRGKPLYLVKWKGYSEAEKTWEPEKNILDRYLIEDFDRRTADDKQAFVWEYRLPQAQDGKSPGWYR